jgi:isopenicillin N synthase-like dioxygenase
LSDFSSQTLPFEDMLSPSALPVLLGGTALPVDAVSNDTKQATADMSEQLPVVDFSPFMVDEGCMAGQAPSEAQLAVASQIDSVMQEHGFLYLKNFGLTEEDLTMAFDVVKPLFQNSGKLAAFDPEKLTGYVPFRVAKVNKPRTLEHREAFFCSPHPTDHVFQGTPDDYAPIICAIWEKLETASRRFMIACALALGLEDELDFFARSAQRMDSCQMKINHYPPCDFQAGVSDGGNGSRAIRNGEHCDFGFATFLLLEDGARGLQVRKAAKGTATAPAGGDDMACESDWIEAPGLGGASAIVNSGALLARWTNDRWRATPHRVIIPNALEAAHDRYSIPFFIQPDASAIIEPHSRLLQPGEDPRYAPISAHEHLMMLLKWIAKFSKDA